MALGALYIVVPCYNEEDALPRAVSVLLGKLRALSGAGAVAADSRLLLVDDGSVDGTWGLIEGFYRENGEICGLKLDCNRGHQNAVMAGLLTACEHADAALTIDADLQDDPDAVDAMVEKWNAGAPVVCGVRQSRESDTAFKRCTAQGFYLLARLGGAKVIYDHADFRLLSREAVARLSCFGTEDLFLRGLVTRLDLPMETVYYDRRPRLEGESKYTMKKMLHLAARGFASGRMKAADSPQTGDLHIERALLQ